MEIYKKVVFTLVAILLGFFSISASAEIEIFSNSGWEAGVRGRLSISCSITDATTGDGLGSEGSSTACGVGRTLLPSEVGLWANTPYWSTALGQVQVSGVIDLAYTTNFHQDDGTGTEIRNGFVKLELTPEGGSGPWKLTLGNQLASFSDVILLDHTLNGVGVPASPESVDTTGLGHIGTGYLFDLGFSFGAKLATASFHGFNLEVGVYNASTIPRLDSSPRYEGQLNYAHQLGGAGVKAWLTAMYQANTYQQNNVDIVGFDGGISVNKGPYGALVYGYTGEGIGSILLNKFFSETVGTPTAFGGLGQIHYKTVFLTKATKLALSYGISAVDRSELGQVKNRQSIIGGAYFDLSDKVNLFLEGGRAWSKIVGSRNAASNFGSLGFNLNF